jgi:hypothetical protein
VRDVLNDQLLSQHVAVPPSIRSQYEYRLRVSPAQLQLGAEAFGDADALLIELRSPHRASAVEFKRVKVSASSFQTGRLNKLNELTKAVYQANALYAAGFAHVWMTVVIVADTRVLTGGAGYGSIPGPMVREVVDAIPFAELALGVGVTVCEIVQVSDQPANFRGMAGGQLIRTAIEREQPAILTAAIGDLFSRAC